MRELVAYKNTVSPKTKILISVGGGNQGFFLPMLDTEDSMREFAVSSVEFLREYEIDGIDLGFEAPTTVSGGESCTPDFTE